MSITINLSVKDTCKLLSKLNQASLVSSCAAAVALPDVDEYEKHMREYEDIQRIRDLIAEQAAQAQ